LSKAGEVKRNLILGGAQFGNGYGKFVHIPKMSPENIRKILGTAKMRDVFEIDLAQDYVGAVDNLATSNVSSQFIFSTKIKYSVDSQNDITSKLIAELKVLQVERFRTILIHNWSSIGQEERIKSVKFLKSLVSLGLCEGVGVSIYEIEEIDFGTWIPDCIQAPLNFYNRKFLYDQATQDLVAEGTQFVGRSIFHQGLLLNPKLSSNSGAMKIFIDFCSGNNLSYLQGALSVYDSQNVFTSLTVGIANPNQLQEILNEGRIVKNLEVYPAVNSVSLDFTDPRRW
jgi:aryl-alcohol dehydrogenase-like predicted oxidoreductase